MIVSTDFSQHGGPLSHETVACWQSKGVSRAIVQYSHLMDSHLNVLAKAGMEAEGYVYLYWDADPGGQSPQTRTAYALSMAGNRIRRLWLDAEDSTSPYREDQLIECVRLCEQAGMPTGVYSGRWWWVPRTGNSQTFAHLPLWHAEYLRPGADADVDFAQRVNFDWFTPYGGWTRPAMWQYQGTSVLCGHEVDMNAIEEVAVAPDLTTEDLKGRVLEAVANKYRPVLRGPNPLGELVVELTNADGSQANPPIYLAVLAPGQAR